MTLDQVSIKPIFSGTSVVSVGAISTSTTYQAQLVLSKFASGGVAARSLVSLHPLFA